MPLYFTKKSVSPETVFGILQTIMTKLNGKNGTSPTRFTRSMKWLQDDNYFERFSRDVYHHFVAQSEQNMLSN